MGQGNLGFRVNRSMPLGWASSATWVRDVRPMQDVSTNAISAPKCGMAVSWLKSAAQPIICPVIKSKTARRN